MVWTPPTCFAPLGPPRPSRISSWTETATRARASTRRGCPCSRMTSPSRWLPQRSTAQQQCSLMAVWQRQPWFWHVLLNSAVGIFGP